MAAGERAMRRQRPEDIEQNNIRRYVSGISGKVYVLGTRRRRGDYQGTMQTEGIADLWICLPAVAPSARYHLDTKEPIALWWETKGPKGRRSPEQIEFGERCAATRTPYGFGTCNDFFAWLIQHGRLSPDQIAHYRRPAAIDAPTPQ